MNNARTVRPGVDRAQRGPVRPRDRAHRRRSRLPDRCRCRRTRHRWHGHGALPPVDGGFDVRTVSASWRPSRLLTGNCSERRPVFRPTRLGGRYADRRVDRMPVEVGAFMGKYERMDAERARGMVVLDPEMRELGECRPAAMAATKKALRPRRAHRCPRPAPPCRCGSPRSAFAEKRDPNWKPLS